MCWCLNSGPSFSQAESVLCSENGGVCCLKIVTEMDSSSSEIFIY
jgi:hypothetical protein